MGDFSRVDDPLMQRAGFRTNGMLLAACLVLAVGVLASAWLTARSSPFLIGGLLPVSDAQGFLFSGLHVLYDGGLDITGARRPLASLYSAGRLLFGGQSLQGAMLFQALLLGVAGWLFAGALWRVQGPVAAVAGFGLVLAAASPGIAAGLSDTGGIVFGLTAFALMARGMAGGACALYAFGVFVLTLGLAIRPGDFAIVPLCAPFAALVFGGRRIKAAGLALAAAAAGIAVALLAGVAFGHPDGMPQANFYYTLYGMSVGQDWAAAFRDIPDLGARLESEGERVVALAVRDLALRTILADPGPFIGRFLANLTGWLLSTPLVGFLGNMGPRSGLTAVVAVVAVLCWRRSVVDRLAVLGVVSTFLSAGISYGDGGWKAALAVSGFWIAPIALLTARLLEMIIFRRYKCLPVRRGQEAAGPPAGAAAVFGGFLVLLATVIPAGVIVSGLLRPHPPQPQAACGAGGIVLRAGFPDATLHVVDNGWPFSFAPVVRVDDFRRNLLAAANEYSGLLAETPAGKKIVYAYDVTQDAPHLRPMMRLVVMVADETLALPAGRYVAVCGTLSRATPWATGPRLLTDVTASTVW